MVRPDCSFPLTAADANGIAGRNCLRCARAGKLWCEAITIVVQSLEKARHVCHTTSPSGLIIEDLAVGEGEAATSGQRVTVHYTGWLADGEKFDSSKDRDDPFRFSLGAGRVIKGWDEGVQGMKVGGSRKLTVPPALGYGARGAGGVIPPNATLIFEVELLDID
jgi:FKBP-type peptidyl-prolyl cis-trans isomerase FkpA